MFWVFKNGECMDSYEQLQIPLVTAELALDCNVITTVLKLIELRVLVMFKEQIRYLILD